MRTYRNARCAFNTRHAITTLQRSVNARRQQAPKHAVAENHGRCGRSSTAAKSTLFSSEGAELAVFFPKTRFRVGGVANGISDFSVKKPISVFDRIEKLGRAARKLMFTSFPVHSEATQQLLQTWLFQHANASQSSNMHCGRRATSVQQLPSHLLLGSGKLALSTVVSSHKLPLLATAQSSRAFQSRQASESLSLATSQIIILQRLHGSHLIKLVSRGHAGHSL